LIEGSALMFPIKVSLQSISLVQLYDEHLIFQADMSISGGWDGQENFFLMVLIHKALSKEQISMEIKFKTK